MTFYLVHDDVRERLFCPLCGEDVERVLEDEDSAILSCSCRESSWSYLSWDRMNQKVFPDIWEWLPE